MARFKKKPSRYPSIMARYYADSNARLEYKRWEAERRAEGAESDENGSSERSEGETKEDK